MKIIAFFALVCFVVAWTIYFYLHIDVLCHTWPLSWDRACIAYNVSHH